tara:strand:+ start:1131 stop:1253 length:123 start_codon:yes stop_codon:yes gene_type:complete
MEKQLYLRVSGIKMMDTAYNKKTVNFISLSHSIYKCGRGY